jgi:molybdopterin molybdotransferase
VNGFDTSRLLAPAQALAAYFASVSLTPPREETADLDDACWRVLARDIVADADYPAGARSSMDGFAIASNSSPGRFRIAGEVRMGSPWSGSLGNREAVRIPTGGLLPPGSDAVVPIEDARVDGDGLDIAATIPPGDCVNPAGEDMRAGGVVLEAGRRIGAPELAVLATLGIASVPVLRQPRIAVLSSGDEIVPPSAIPAPGQIRDSNRYAIAASLRAMGAHPVHYPTVADEQGALAAALRAALGRNDGAVLSGGSSVGERDVTPAAIASLGEPGVVVHGLRIKPGKPTVLGAVGGKPVVGLPGNPVSALIVLEAVAAPIIGALVGARAQPEELDAKLGAPLIGRLDWTCYAPVTLEDEGGRLVAHPLALRSSHVSLPARSAGYVTMAERDGTLETGTRVRVRRFLTGGNRAP